MKEVQAEIARLKEAKDTEVATVEASAARRETVLTEEVQRAVTRLERHASRPSNSVHDATIASLQAKADAEARAAQVLWCTRVLRACLGLVLTRSAACPGSTSRCGERPRRKQARHGRKARCAVGG